MRLCKALIWSHLALVTGYTAPVNAQWVEITGTGPTYWCEYSSTDCEYLVWGREYTAVSFDLSINSNAGPIAVPAGSRSLATALYRDPATNNAQWCPSMGWRDSYAFTGSGFAIGVADSIYSAGEHWPIIAAVPGVVEPGVYSFSIDTSSIVAFGTVDGFNFADLSGATTAEVTVYPGGFRVWIGTPLRGDIDQSGLVDLDDLFTFLAAWFMAAPVADWDDSGVIAAPDIFAYLTDFFGSV